MLAVAVSGVSLTGCGSAASPAVYLTDPVSVTDYKLNTYVEISSYTTGGYSTNRLKEVLNGALELCDTYERMFSRTMEGSDLYRLNHGETDIVPAKLGELIETGLHYSKLSDGAFDITIGAVSSLWDFTADNPVVPEASLIEDALRYVDYTSVSIIKNADSTYTVNMPAGTVIDLGAVAKGYIADKIKEYLLANNITSAIINLGGNVLCVGEKRDSSFNIAVRKPFSESDYVDILKISDMSVVSSGNYERYFYEDGKLYHHILNPRTGYSYDNGISEITIVSSDSLTGDCLSTTCFALGLDAGLALIESLDGVEAEFISTDGEVTYSSGLQRYK